MVMRDAVRVRVVVAAVLTKAVTISNNKRRAVQWSHGRLAL
jgi:hypothetical protein